MQDALEIELYLLRHGPSLRREHGAWGRNYDAPLSREHLQDLNIAKEALLTLKNFTLYSSPLRRCLESLDYTLGPSRIVEIVPEFRAYHSGLFETMSIAEVQMRFPEYVKSSYSDRFLIPAYGEESIAAQTRRVRLGLQRMVCNLVHTTAIVCTHYSVINIIGNIVVGNMDTSTYGEGRFDVSEGGLISFRTTRRTLIIQDD